MRHAQKIKAFITDELAPDIDAAELPDDYDILSNGVVDSLSLERLVAWTGEEFSVPINDIDLAPEDLSSVARINAFIERHAPQAAL